jgi:anti-sigma B factor antagonist
MKFEDRTEGKVLVVKVLESRIVADIAPQFKEGMVSYIAQGHHVIVLDLSEVKFIDSTGLGALIGSLKAMGTDDELVLAGAKDSVSNMLKLTRMDKVFRLFPTAEEAVSTLA